jgi:hypothetical protein
MKLFHRVSLKPTAFLPFFTIRCWQYNVVALTQLQVENKHVGNRSRLITRKYDRHLVQNRGARHSKL